jgi:hypothetical protein
MAMTLHEAMRAKDRLVKRLQAVRHDVQQHNRSVRGNPQDLDARAALELEAEVFATLVRVRAAIARANAPVQERIVRMIELRSRISFLNSVPTQRGVAPGPHGFMGVADATEYEVQIDRAMVEEQVRQAEIEIDAIQTELGRFNHETMIDVDVPPRLLF